MPGTPERVALFIFTVRSVEAYDDDMDKVTCEETIGDPDMPDTPFQFLCLKGRVSIREQIQIDIANIALAQHASDQGE